MCGCWVGVFLLVAFWGWGVVVGGGDGGCMHRTRIMCTFTHATKTHAHRTASADPLADSPPPPSRRLSCPPRPRPPRTPPPGLFVRIVACHSQSWGHLDDETLGAYRCIRIRGVISMIY